MKTTLVTFLAIACISSVSYAADEMPAAGAVVVKVLDKPLPSDDGKKDEFLWDNFPNSPDKQKYNSYTTENWKQNFGSFAADLVKSLIRRICW